MLTIAAFLAIAAPADLADVGPAPAVRLIDQEGRPFDLESLRGRAVVVSFVYTTCQGSCPATTAALVRVQEALKQAKLWGDRVAFVSITLDPARDTPSTLDDYARVYRADPVHWRFVTGQADAVAAVWKAWDMWARVGPSGVIDHPSRIFLVDPRGRIREIYNLESLTPEAVARDVERVTRRDAAR